MKWQVRSTDGNVVQYYEPEKFQIAMFNATLKVQLGASNKIHEGACKTVCAWVQCEDFQVLGQSDLVKKGESDFYVRFNPRVNPNWTDASANRINDENFNLLITEGRNIFAVVGHDECSE